MGVEVEERILTVEAVVLVELLVLLILDVALVPSPEGRCAVDLFPLMLCFLNGVALTVLLVSVALLIILEIDRICDVVRILLYETLKAIAACILLTFLVEMEDDGSALTVPFGRLNGIAALSFALPAECFITSGLSAYYLNL